MPTLASVAALVASQDAGASVWDISAGDGTDLRALRPGFVAFASLPWFPQEVDTPPFTVESGPGGLPACRVTSTSAVERWGGVQGWGVFLIETVFAFSGTVEVWADVGPLDLVFSNTTFLGHLSYSSTAGAYANTAADGGFAVQVASTAAPGSGSDGGYDGGYDGPGDGAGDLPVDEGGEVPEEGAQYASTPAPEVTTEGPTPLLTGWHLYTVTWDGPFVLWYVDGVLTQVVPSGNYADDDFGAVFTFFRGMTGGVMLPLLSGVAHTPEQIRARYDHVTGTRRAAPSHLGLGLALGRP